MITAKRVVLYGAYLVLIGGLIVIIVLSFKSSGTKPTPSSTPKQHHAVASQPKSTNQPKSSSQPASSKPTPSSSSNQPAASSSGGSSAAQGTASLTNSGPGNVIALFVGASTVGAFVHWRRTVRRLY